MQTILSILLLAVAVGYLFWLFGGKKLLKAHADGKKEDCGPDCNCS